MTQLDLVLRGGTVVDGSGAAGRIADVAVTGGRIAAVGEHGGMRGAEEVDASGLVVCPGFVDVHSHMDLVWAMGPEAQARYGGPRVRQGITTEVVGNCGLGAAPVGDANRGLVGAVNAFVTPPDFGPEYPWQATASYLERVEEVGTLLNVAALVPHGPLRTLATGRMDGTPDAGQMDRMQSVLAEGLEAGALGVSFGLIYPPGQYAPTDELEALGEVCARGGGLAAFHQRAGNAELCMQALAELGEVGRTGCRVHLSHDHLHGEDAWSLLERWVAAGDGLRAEGIDLAEDVIPYTGVNTTMLAILPPWALAGGVEGFLRVASDRVARVRMADEIRQRVPSWPPWGPDGWCTNIVRESGIRRIRVAHAGGGASDGVVGMSLEELGEARGMDPVDAVIDLLIEAGGDVTMLCFGISGDEDTDAVLRQLMALPTRSICTDAWETGQACPHPGAAGAFPHVLARYVRETGTLGLEEAVNKMTGQPAERFGLDGEVGFVEAGRRADLVLFDPERIASTSTFANPRSDPVGIEGVWIGGRRVVAADGSLEALDAGCVLRAGG